MKDVTLDKDCVGRYSAKDHEEARKKAFAAFGDKFFTTYEEKDFKASNLQYFPRGFVDFDI